MAIASSKLLSAAVKEDCGLGVVRARLLVHPKADQEHDDEADDERDRYLHHIQEKLYD